MIINPDGTIQYEGEASRLTPARGAAAATPGADLTAQNRAARIARYGSDQVGRMEAAGSTFGAASAPSAPTATNPAPVATAVSSTTPTFGARAMKLLRLGGRALGIVGRGAGVAQAGYGASQVARGDLLAGGSNLAMGAATAIHPGVGLIGEAIGSAGDTIGNMVQPFVDRAYNAGGIFPKESIFGGGGAVKAATVAPAASAPVGTTIPEGVTAYRGLAAAPGEAQLVASGVQPLPAAGTGVATNQRTGRALTFNTGAQVAAGGPPISAAEYDASRFGTAPEQRIKSPVGQDLINAAYEARDRRRSMLAATQAIAMQKVQAATLGATGMYLRGQAAVANAGNADKKVTSDITGNPIIVNTRAGTAMAPTVKKPIAEADITATMKEMNMTRDAVMARLRSEGRL